MPSRRAPHSDWVYVALVVLTGVVGLGFATSRNIGVTPDAVVYLDAARHLAAGNGFVSWDACSAVPLPVRRFPPLYPFLLAVLACLGIEPLQAARLLSLSLFAINAALVALIVKHFAPRSVFAPAAAALFLCCSPVVLEIHTTALSEPLFLFFVLLGLFGLQLHLERRRPLLLAASGLAFGAASLARFTGPSLLATAAVVLLFNRRVAFHRRLQDATLCCVLAALPGILWLLDRFFAGAMPGGNWQLSPLTLSHLKAVLVTMGSWLVPGSDRLEYFVGQDLLLAAIVTGAVAAVVRWRGEESVPAIPRPVAFEAFAIVYLGFLLLSILVYSSLIPLDNRLLSPVFVCVLIVVIHRVEAFLLYAAKSLQHLAMVVTVALAGAYVVAAVAIVVHLHSHGRGFTGDAWQLDELSRAVAALEPDVVIFADIPAGAYFLTGRDACILPLKGWQSREADIELRKKFSHGPVAVVRFGERRQFTPREPAATRLPVFDREWEILEGVDLELIVDERGATLHRVVRRP